MKKMPRLLPGYIWDVDRTSDVLSVRLLHGRVTIGWAVVPVDGTLRARLLLMFLRGLWDEYVWGPMFAWINAVKDWDEKRRDARSERRQALAASLDGYWNHKGQMAPHLEEPLADWELELLATTTLPSKR